MSALRLASVCDRSFKEPLGISSNKKKIGFIGKKRKVGPIKTNYCGTWDADAANPHRIFDAALSIFLQSNQRDIDGLPIHSEPV